MPRVSAKRKALSELNRLKGLKRQSKGREKQRNEVEPLAAPHSATADPPRFPPPSTPHVSAASFRHSLLPDELRETITVSDNSALLTISLERLQAVLDLVNCVECGKKCVTKITTHYFDCTFSLRCEDCSVIIHHSEPKKCQDNNFSEGNITFVYHSLSEGYGRAGMSRLCTAMGSKEMSSATFMQKAEFIYSEMNSFYDEHTRVVKNCVERLYEKEGRGKDEDGILSTDVSFDGTWMTRGHKSRIGATFVMDMSSGMTIDFEILSNFCRACSIVQKRKDKKSFEEWRKTVHAGKCQKNFEGKSGAMEAEGAVRIWGRSLDNGYRYVTFLGDGDSSSFRAVSDMNGGKGPYNDVTVMKEECVNHVQKRMGTRLRKLKDELKEEKTTKTGKVIKRSLVGGKHQLTDAQINNFQRYYGKAIRDSVGTNFLTMKLKIMSGFWHAISRDGDGNHHHNHCDPAWCIFKKAKNENQPLPSHSIMRNYIRLEKKYEDKVRAVYHDLSSPALLQKCLKGESQNRNEGFHCKLWYHQSKAKFAGMKRVKFVTQLTVIDHNFGYMANKFLQHLGFSATTSSLTARQRMDKRKITPRKNSKTKKHKTAPGPDYQPGGF